MAENSQQYKCDFVCLECGHSFEDKQYLLVNVEGSDGISRSKLKSMCSKCFSECERDVEVLVKGSTIPGRVARAKEVDLVSGHTLAPRPGGGTIMGDY